MFILFDCQSWRTKRPDGFAIVSSENHTQSSINVKCHLSFRRVYNFPREVSPIRSPSETNSTRDYPVQDEDESARSVASGSTAERSPFSATAAGPVRPLAPPYRPWRTNGRGGGVSSCPPVGRDKRSARTIVLISPPAPPLRHRRRRRPTDRARTWSSSGSRLRARLRDTHRSLAAVRSLAGFPSTQLSRGDWSPPSLLTRHVVAFLYKKKYAP